jgi:hypothetical protein
MCVEVAGIRGKPGCCKASCRKKEEKDKSVFEWYLLLDEFAALSQYLTKAARSSNVNQMKTVKYAR